MKRISIVTDYPVAFDSPDHLVPLGTKADNHSNMKFVKSCERLISDISGEHGSVLDIGCAGGACVEDFIKRGHNVVGIEGSDYSLTRKRASWANVPDRLFTCDASRPYQIQEAGKNMKFDIVYSFEVMEHIVKSRLSTYFRNIYNHMHSRSIFIGSFTTTKSKKFPKHHQTIMNKKQWRLFIKNLQLFQLIDLKWRSKQYLRESKKKENCIPISFKMSG